MIGDVLRKASRPSGPLLSQAAGLALGLAGQAFLLSQIGSDRFAAIGLALVTAQAIAFVGELGFARSLIAAAARGDAWEERWRGVVARRLAVLALLSAAAPLVWLAIRGLDDGLLTLLLATPGVLASAWDPDPCLNGGGKHSAAGRALVLRWTAYAAVMAATAAASAFDNRLGAGAGLAASVSWVAALLVARRHRLLCVPSLRARVPELGARYLWASGVLGAVFAAALPFGVEAREPELAAIIVLSIQVLNGLAALAGRLDRLVLPALVGGGDPAVLRQLWTTAVMAVSAAAAAVLLLTVDHRVALPCILLLVEWQCGVTAGLEVSMLVLLGRERWFWWGQAAVLGPVLAVHALPPELMPLVPLLWLRIGACLGLLVWVLRVVGHRVEPWTALALATIIGIAACATAGVPVKVPALAVATLWCARTAVLLRARS